MRTRLFLLVFPFLLLIAFAPEAAAQLKGARSYTKRIGIEPVTGVRTNSPAGPGNAAAAVLGGKPSTPAAVAPPAPPVVRVVPAPPPGDPNKAQAAKEETLRKTIAFQKKRAEEGSTSAQYDLGLRYLTGDGLEKDSEAARRWLETAAKGGHTQAARKLQELDKK